MELVGKSTTEILQWAVQQFGDRVALACSFGAEDMVLIDMLSRLGKFKAFTLDTGRLHEETYQLMAKATRRYPQMELHIMFPDRAAVEQMVKEKGINLFYDSVENRKTCCYVRKIEPLSRALEGLDAWMTGVRADQTPHRATMEVVENDVIPISKRPIVKINPLLHWSYEQVWEYIRANQVPYNVLHDRGFPSIGCAPCTRAIEPGEDLRAGRWWWEQDNKECGLHVTAQGDLVRTNVT
ncbi:MAG: phosphoadenylyl-sulfate reductase [Pseudanabaenaceae cyanobacterium]